MTDPEVNVAASTGDTLGESPTFLPATGELYWIDLRAPALHRLDALGAVTSWTMPEVIGAVVARRSGGLIVALKDGLHAFDPSTGRTTPLVTLERGLPENRLNDAKCDAAGRMWCGSMWDFGAQTRGSLYRIGDDGTVATIRTGVTVANAIAFAPDGRTLYFTDSAKGVIEQASVDPVTGAVGSVDRVRRRERRARKA